MGHSEHRDSGLSVICARRRFLKKEEKEAKALSMQEIWAYTKCIALALLAL